MTVARGGIDLLRKVIAHYRMLRFLRWGRWRSVKPLGPFGIYMRAVVI